MFEQKLYGLEKNGDVKVWTIKVEQVHCDMPEAMITIQHGKENGNLTTKVESILTGKQGRSVYEQAMSEAHSRIKKNLDKNYRAIREDLFKELPLLAMLAKDACMDKLDKVKFKYDRGLHLSDKLDGLRCLAKCILIDEIKTVTIESRTGQLYDVPHIVEELMGIMEPGDILDGELYVHGPILQEISSAVSRIDPQGKINETYLKVAKQLNKFGPDSDQYKKAKVDYNEANRIALIRHSLEFRVFDLVKMDVPFRDRLFDLQEYAVSRFKSSSDPYGKVLLVGYITVYSKEELRAAHKDAVERGYEGVMIRTHDGVYESGKRSAGLYKYKEFMDSEFLILDIIPDKQGYGVFELKNDLNSETFTCVMGDMDQRASYLRNKVVIVGNWLKVKYQARYKGTLLPQFPTGIMLRECDKFGNVLE